MIDWSFVLGFGFGMVFSALLIDALNRWRRR
jgi:hypothetical protein